MVNKSTTAIGNKKVADLKKPANGKGSKKEDDEPYVATKAAKNNKAKQNGAAEPENKVKRPLSAFFHFCAERRITLKQESPDLGMAQSTKKMSEEWKNLDAKKKKKYDDLNARDKERYEKELSESGGNNKKKKKAGATGQTGTTGDEEGKPKRPINAYFLYQSERMDLLKKEQPGKPHMEYTKLLSKEWQEMDKNKKEKYEKRAQEFKDKYEVEKKEYNDSKNGAVKQAAVKGKPQPVNKNGNKNAAPAKDAKKTAPTNNKKQQEEEKDDEEDGEDEENEEGDEEEDGEEEEESS